MCDAMQFTGKRDKIFTADFVKKKSGKFIRPRRHKTSSNQNAIFIGYDTLDLMFFEYAYETRTPNLYDHTGLLGLTIMKLSSVSFVFVLLKCPIRALHPIKHPIRTLHLIKHPIRTLNPIKHPIRTLHPIKHPIRTLHPIKHPIRALHPIKHPIRTWHPIKHPIRTLHPIKHPIRTLHPICIAFWLKVCGLWVPNFILERVL